MSQINRVSEEINEQEAKEVEDCLKRLGLIFGPKLVGLSKKERKSLPKMKDKTFALGNKVNSYVDTNPEFMPPFMDKGEFQKDLRLVQVLKPVLDAVSVLKSNLDDTMLLAASEAYTGALIYYHSVKYAAEKGNAAAKPVFEDLAQRFATQGNRKKSEVVPPAK